MSSHVVLVSLDGTAAEQLTHALEALDLSVTLARDVGTALNEVGGADLIVVEAANTPSLALLCRRINDEAGSTHAPILAVVAASDVDTRVKMLEAGADDVLAPPIDERELAAMVDALMLRSSAAGAARTPEAQAAPRQPAAPGRAIVFAAAKGGSGTTTLAVNAAVALAEMAPGNVAIADLDMYHGQVSTHLDIYGRGSTATLAREDLYSYSTELIAETGRRHPSGLIVYGGPYRPDDAQGLSGDHLGALVNALRGMYATVVVDAGSTLDGRAMSIINRADRVAMVITPDIPALRLLHGALEVLSEVGSAPERTTFVVNDVYPKTSIGADQIEEHLGIKIGLELPYDGENILRGINEGQPVVSLARRTAFATSMRRLAEMLTDNSADEGQARPQKKSRLGGLLGRS